MRQREKGKAGVQPALQSSTLPLPCCSTYVHPARGLLAHPTGPPLPPPFSSAAHRMTISPHTSSFSQSLPCHLFLSHDISFISARTPHSSPHLSPPICPVPNLARSRCRAIHLPQSLSRSMNMPVFSFINTFAFICFRPRGYCFLSFSECLQMQRSVVT